MSGVNKKLWSTQRSKICNPGKKKSTESNAELTKMIELTINKMKNNGKKTFANNISNKRLISKIYIFTKLEEYEP